MSRRMQTEDEALFKELPSAQLQALLLPAGKDYISVLPQVNDEIQLHDIVALQRFIRALVCRYNYLSKKHRQALLEAPPALSISVSEGVEPPKKQESLL